MLYQAHRGVSTDFPENTMPAFRGAWEQGYPVIELDPAFTADNQCVVFHDKVLHRTCRYADGSLIPEEITIGDVTWEQLQELDAGLFKGEQFRGTKVPLLREALEYAAEKGIHVKIDNKFQRFTPEQKQILFDTAEQSGADFGFTCTRMEIIDEVVARFPTHTIHFDGAVTPEILEEVTAHLNGAPLTVWLPLPSRLTTWVKVPMATPEMCRLVKQYGRLGLWILEDPEQLETAKALGGDIIETTGSLKP